uniref:Niban apoptosis regulator 2a n=1 Tax=Scleropages formosus TaxID=113540 RepID=A0A8C9WFU7_SCLFO
SLSLGLEHLVEGATRTRKVLAEFGTLYQQQYGLALFNKVRFEIEGTGGPQSQLLHRKVPLEGRSIFSGAVYQYLEENKKWRIRFLFIPDSYNIECFESKQAHDRGQQPKGVISCAGYKVLTSMDEYLELLNNSLPGVKAKAGGPPFPNSATQFPLLLWHPYTRHYCFCVLTEKEHNKWMAVFQDCIRHANNGLPEDNKVQTPAFTDSVRLYRQHHEQYGTWDMMCGRPPQILANLVMETLVPELRNLIGPRLKGKLYQRQRNWMLILDAVYHQVLCQTQAQYEALVQVSYSGQPQLESSIRTDMDQIITSKEHVTSKIRALVQPKAEQLLKDSVEPDITFILEALMEPTSRGFAEVRDLFFRELTDMSNNIQNDGSREKLGEHMEKVSMLAYHPVKMQSCYDKVEQMNLEGLQQKFDVSSPSVFIQRAQILMREQMDNTVYTFEHLLHQSLSDQEGDEVPKIIQRCLDRVMKKYDYDSSTVRKKFFKEALLQIIIPYMLKQLNPSCAQELPRFRELIFEDFSRFILVENIFEEVVLQSAMKDIMLAVREAAVQRKHNLYRDSMILAQSDPNLHMLEENPPIDWAASYGPQDEGGTGDSAELWRRRRQVVSMILLDDWRHLQNESCMEVPGVDGIREEEEESKEEDKAEEEEDDDQNSDPSPVPDPSPEPGSSPTKSPDSVHEIRGLINPMLEVLVPVSELNNPVLTNGLVLQGEEPKSRHIQDDYSKALLNRLLQKEGEPPAWGSVRQAESRLSAGSGQQEAESERFSGTAMQFAVHQQDDSGFQSPVSEGLEDEGQAITAARKVQPVALDPESVMVTFESGDEESELDPISNV